jgi:hypothetical protein
MYADTCTVGYAGRDLFESMLKYRGLLWTIILTEEEEGGGWSGAGLVLGVVAGGISLAVL